MNLPASVILAFAFLSPAFAIAGAVLAGVPILIHLLNRRRYRIVEWAAMDFLLRAMKRNRRRLRFESWLLLATRCAVLALLGLALARPMSCSSSALAKLGQSGGLHVIVIDNSYSMAYTAADGTTHLDHARQLALQQIDRFTPGSDAVAVISAGTPAAMVIAKPTFDLQQAKSAVAHLPQLFGGTNLPQAFRLALAIAQENAPQPGKDLSLFTDSTRSAWNSPASAELKQLGPALAQQFRVTLFDLSPGPQHNGAVVSVEPLSNLLTTGGAFGSDFVATVRGFGDGSKTQLQWRLDGALLPGSGSLDLASDPPPQIRPNVALHSAGPHVIAASLDGGDPLAVDDQYRRVVNVLAQAKALIVEGQHGSGALGGSGAFLQLALSPGGSGPSPGGAISAETVSDLELGNRPLTDLQAVLLCGVGQIRPGVADQLQRFVQQGGTLMLFMGDNVTSDNYNEVLLPRHLLPGPLTRRVTAPSDQSFGFAFDPNGNLHPLLAAFAHQEKTGLNTAQVLTYWQADVPNDPQLRVLNYRDAATAAAGKPDPAVTVHSLGQGHVIFFSTTANADWTTLPAKPAYVALVNELLANSVSRDDGWMNLTVGDRLQTPPALRLAAIPTLLDPHGHGVDLQAVQQENAMAYRSTPLAEPGQYTLHTSDIDFPVVVNVPALAEADVRTIDAAALRAALGNIDMTFATDQLPPPALASEAGSELGWDVMLLVGVLASLECVLAMFFGYGRRS